MTQYIKQHWFPVLLLVGLGIQATSLFNGIMEVDAMLYATIAKHMAISNDWVNLFGDGHDWLDKPHMPFWLEAMSFKIFGINDFAYKLPGFLSFLGAAYYCYLFAAKMYDKHVAKIATIILITSLHLFLAVFDLRAEAFLTFFIIAATYNCYRAMPTKWSMHIIWAALYCAAACMTKGIFVLVSIGGGLVVYWIYNKQWSAFIQLKWWLLLVLTLLFVTPELYCLYVQFDAHPEKLVLGSNNVSGIKFFFWDSQFGRFFDSGPIKGHGDPFFFVHTFLWAFLPWSLIAYVSTFVTMKRMNTSNSGLLLLSGSAIITFLLFSLSKFQLPHYIVIVFPHFAIVSAVYLASLKTEKTMKRWNQFFVFLIGIAIVFVVLMAVLTKFANILWPILLAVLGTAVFISQFRKATLIDLLGKGVCFALVLYLYMNLFFYPSLLNYQGGKNAAAFLNTELRAAKAIMYQCNRYAFQWYANAHVLTVNELSAVPATMKAGATLVVLTTPDKLDALKAEVVSFKELHRFGHFRVSELTLPFLRPASREGELSTLVLVECRLK